MESFELGGDPDSILGSAQHWTSFGTSAHSAAGTVSSLESSLFQGDEADTYRSRIHQDMTPHLKTTGEAWTSIGGALGRYSDTLRGLQERMRKLKADAGDQQSKVTASSHALNTAKAADLKQSLQPKPDATYVSTTSSASTSHQNAVNALDTSIAGAAQIRKEHHEAVQLCCTSIDNAKHQRFQKPPGFWDRLGSAIVSDFKCSLAFAVKYISPALKMISMVTGVLALIPFLTPIMGPISLATGATALAIDVLNKLVTGQGSWTQIGLDTLGLVPGVKQLSTFGKMAKLGKVATDLEDASRGVKAAKTALTAAKDAKPRLAFLTKAGRAAKSDIKNAKTGLTSAQGALKNANRTYKAVNDHFDTIAKNWRRVELATSSTTAGLTGYRNYELNHDWKQAVLAGSVSALAIKNPLAGKKFTAIQNIVSSGAATGHQALNMYVLHPELANNPLQQAKLITGAGKIVMHSTNAGMYSSAGTHPNGMPRAAFELPQR